MNKLLITFTTSDPERSEDLKNTLRNMLTEYDDINILKSQKESIPKGAMAADPISIGALALAAISTLMPTIINAVKEIKLKNKDLSVKIKVKIDGKEIDVEFSEKLNKDEIELLTQSFIDKLSLDS